MLWITRTVWEPLFTLDPHDHLKFGPALHILMFVFVLWVTFNQCCNKSCKNFSKCYQNYCTMNEAVFCEGYYIALMRSPIWAYFNIKSSFAKYSFHTLVPSLSLPERKQKEVWHLWSESNVELRLEMCALYSIVLAGLSTCVCDTVHCGSGLIP